MTRIVTRTILGLGTVLACAAGALASSPASVGAPTPADAVFGRTSTSIAVPAHASGAKSGTEALSLGAAWVLRVQGQDGGWGAGAMGVRDSGMASDVATTAYVVMALSRAGGDKDTYAAARNKGVEFVVKAIETAPAGPRLNTPEGTQPQVKLGQLVDTHLAAMMLGEVMPLLPKDLRDRANVAYDTVLTKVQQAQNADGSFDGNGWAPVLSTSIAAQSLEVAAAQGKDVDEKVLDKANEYNLGLVGETGEVDAGAGAGVQLYAMASSLGANAKAATRTPSAPAAARADATGETLAQDMAARGGGGIAAGFGSAGGEEMLSYMMISDTLAEKGGAEWQQWKQGVETNLLQTQNQDGSWAGHHCITSPVFVTAGAMMTLSAEQWAARKRQG